MDGLQGHGMKGVFIRRRITLPPTTLPAAKTASHAPILCKEATWEIIMGAKYIKLYTIKTTSLRRHRQGNIIHKSKYKFALFSTRVNTP